MFHHGMQACRGLMVLVRNASMVLVRNAPMVLVRGNKVKISPLAGNFQICGDKMIEYAVTDFFFICEKCVLRGGKQFGDKIGRQTDEQYPALRLIAFHMAQVSVDQAAGACGVQIILSLDFLHDRSFQNDHKFIKVVEVRRVFRVGIIFHGE